MENGFLYITKYSEKFKKLIIDLAKKAEDCSKIKTMDGIGIFLFGSPSRQEMVEESDAVYSSDSHRCLEVAEKISKKYTLPLLTNEFFRERSHGVYEGKSLDELETFLDNQKGDMQNVRVPNGESLKDLYLRAIEGRGAIVGGNFNKPVLISHGSFLKMFLGYLLNMNPVQSNNCLKFSNWAISKIRHQKEGDWRIEYLNNRDFIPKNLR